MAIKSFLQWRRGRKTRALRVVLIALVTSQSTSRHGAVVTRTSVKWNLLKCRPVSPTPTPLSAVKLESTGSLRNCTRSNANSRIKEIERSKRRRRDWSCVTLFLGRVVSQNFIPRGTTCSDNLVSLNNFVTLLVIVIVPSTFYFISDSMLNEFFNLSLLKKSYDWNYVLDRCLIEMKTEWNVREVSTGGVRSYKFFTDTW